jgi:hypothetical protein
MYIYMYSINRRPELVSVLGAPITPRYRGDDDIAIFCPFELYNRVRCIRGRVGYCHRRTDDDVARGRRGEPIVVFGLSFYLGSARIVGEN